MSALLVTASGWIDGAGRARRRSRSCVPQARAADGARRPGRARAARRRSAPRCSGCTASSRARRARAGSPPSSWSCGVPGSRSRTSTPRRAGGGRPSCAEPLDVGRAARRGRRGVAAARRRARVRAAVRPDGRAAARARRPAAADPGGRERRPQRARARRRRRCGSGRTRRARTSASRSATTGRDFRRRSRRWPRSGAHAGRRGHGLAIAARVGGVPRRAAAHRAGELGRVRRARAAARGRCRGARPVGRAVRGPLPAAKAARWAGRDGGGDGVSRRRALLRCSASRWCSAVSRRPTWRGARPRCARSSARSSRSWWRASDLAAGRAVGAGDLACAACRRATYRSGPATVPETLIGQRAGGGGAARRLPRRRPARERGRRRGSAGAQGRAGGRGRRARRARPVVPGARVDVLVTRDGDGGAAGRRPRPSSRSRTSRCSPRGRRRPARATTARERVAATLRVSVRDAVYLAAAQSFAREVRLLPRAAGDRGRAGGVAVGPELR